MEWSKDLYLISTDNRLLDIGLIHSFLSRESYWAKGIPRHIVEDSTRNSICFGLYTDGQQIGFGRVVSDYVTFAYLADIFIIDQFRNKGLAKWLMECIRDHPSLQGLRRWMLATRDAHGLYEQYGFTPLKNPEIFMEKHDPDIYD